jgi:hypothetical protein
LAKLGKKVCTGWCGGSGGREPSQKVSALRADGKLLPRKGDPGKGCGNKLK